MDKEINLEVRKNIAPFPFMSATQGINGADENL